MTQKRKIPGLRWRKHVWHIEKQVLGVKIHESTGTACIEQAQRILAKRMDEVRQAKQLGVIPPRPFSEAATRYLHESQHLASLSDIRIHLRQLAPYIGHLPLTAVHAETLKPFISDRLAAGIKHKSINLALQVIQRILTLAVHRWRDSQHQPWLGVEPKLPYLDLSDKRLPCPLTWREQARLMAELPPHLAAAIGFKVNTGCREQEVCQLQWAWERPLPALGTSVFVIPRDFVKNREDRLVVLNRTALAVIEGCRGQHARYVFTYRGRPVTKLNNTAWKNARQRAGLRHIRVHDMKHTFGRRLRAVGVPLETRKVLLGHKNGDITTHYSQPELEELLIAVRKIDEVEFGKTSALDIL